MKAPKSKYAGDFKIAPQGSHMAILNAVVDFGMQPGSEKFPKPKRCVYLRFELVNESVEYEKDGQKVNGPMSIGRTFSFTMSSMGNLRPFIEGLYGRKFPSDSEAENFEFRNLLGRNCLVTVTHDQRGGRTYPHVHSAGPLPAGMKIDKGQSNASLFFSLDEPDDKEFQRLPRWMQERIEKRMPDEDIPEKSPLMAHGHSSQEIDDDDIPF